MNPALEAAGLLLRARAERRRIPAPLPAKVAPEGLAGAYAIQEASIPAILSYAGGGRPVGRKVGCTNPTAQAQLGIASPFHGRLLSPYVWESPARVPAELFFMRILEPEFAFRLGRDLPAAGAPYTAETVRPAVAAVMPALEIVDSRWADWTTAGALHLIADNGSNGGWVRGPETTDLGAVDFSNHATSISLNGELRHRGSAANVLGNPLNALAWLATELAGAGQALKAGDYVSTGTTTVVVPAEKGDEAVADFGALGRAALAFV
jgi:2-keto-4-pentenoate hydratase